ncbi:DoxX family protein [Nocardiopsis ansamitocini]|uniref:DoxX family protein n=1 Tax=Nocardiopsis ansamitocini TaxID=1670832 RepID=A0A9W6P755_9ACTN|nr:DoxX family protein [Nocardiopsis ansamitocini]GLU48371.1 hypothetical protein Nans01_27220 [Nocardiopsis ansamitocini]
MTTKGRLDRRSPASRWLDITLWGIQWILASVFVGGGAWKLITPVAQLAEVFPWVGETPLALLYVTSGLDILGGLGVLLPALTRVKPQLTALAALGCSALQVCAIAFHLFRGETDVAFNVVLALLSAFVVWGRRAGAPVMPRT